MSLVVITMVTLAIAGGIFVSLRASAANEMGAAAESSLGAVAARVRLAASDPSFNPTPGATVGYVPCATPAALTIDYAAWVGRYVPSDAGLRVTVTVTAVKYWSTAGSYSAACSTDRGIELLTLRVTVTRPPSATVLTVTGNTVMRNPAARYQ